MVGADLGFDADQLMLDLGKTVMVFFDEFVYLSTWE